MKSSQDKDVFGMQDIIDKVLQDHEVPPKLKSLVTICMIEGMAEYGQRIGRNAVEIARGNKSPNNTRV